MAGRVGAIRIAPSEGAPMVDLARVRAFAGGGLDGDRYHSRTGHYSDRVVPGRGLTLVAVESIDAANAELEIPITPAHTRRNLTVSGIDLERLIEREFRVGEVRCVGVRLAEPCVYLQGLIGRPVLAALAHRAGLRADILEEGEIAVGDPVVPL